MNRLVNKLNTLLQPRIEQADCYLGPLTSEIRTSADLMLWFADELPVSRTLLADELVVQHRNWPNVHDWRNFVKAIEALSAEPVRIQHPTRADSVGGTADAYPDQGTTMDMVMQAFADAQARLLTECQLMLAEAPGAKEPKKACHSPFLSTDSQRRVYREHVQAYYREYIVGKDLKHKDLMVHWAAVYQAIADRIGIRKEVPFCGPDFDEFVYDYCGIAYNNSPSRRGRYRSIQDLRARCVDIEQSCPQREDFLCYRSNMNRIISSQMRVVGRSGSDIPRKLG